jgi:hypothetical protein
MIPGVQSKLSSEVVASASSITVKSDIVKVTGSTAINTILSPLMLDRGGLFLVLIPVDGTVVLGTSGNILVGISAVINRAVFLVYDAVVGKWYINSGV